MTTFTYITVIITRRDSLLIRYNRKPDSCPCTVKLLQLSQLSQLSLLQLSQPVNHPYHSRLNCTKVQKINRNNQYDVNPTSLIGVIITPCMVVIYVLLTYKETIILHASLHFGELHTVDHELAVMVEQCKEMHVHVAVTVEAAVCYCVEGYRCIVKVHALFGVKTAASGQ